MRPAFSPLWFVEALLFTESYGVLPLELPPEDPPVPPEPLDDPPDPPLIDPPELPLDDPPELAPISDPGGQGLVPEASAPGLLLEEELPLFELELLLELPCLELSVDPGAQSCLDAPLLLELDPPKSP